MTFIQGTVTIADLAKATRKSEAKATAEATELGIFVGTDWAGRPAVAEADAHAVASGQARAIRERDAAWRAHQTRTEQWEKDRQRAYESAAAEAHNRATRQGRGGPAAHREAEEAGKAAAEKFEKKNKIPTFEGTPTTRSWFDQEVGAR